MKLYETKRKNQLLISLVFSKFTSLKSAIKDMEIRPYYKSELAQAYAPDITLKAALNRLALWIKTNTQLTEALKQTNYRSTQQIFTSRQVALIFEHLGEP